MTIKFEDTKGVL